MAVVSLLLPVLMLAELEPLPAVALAPDPLLFCGMVPVVPIGPPAGFCWPAAVAGLGVAVVGGFPCAKAVPAAATANAATSAEVLFMANLLERSVGMRIRQPEAGP